MANNGFIERLSIEDYIVLFDGVVIDGFDIEGDAITSAKLRDAGAPVEGSGGYLCQGSQASDTDILTFRVLRGSEGARRLRRAVGTNQVGRLSVRQRNLPIGNPDYFFYTCAYFESSTASGPNIAQDKIEVFTCYATGLRTNDIEVVVV